MKWSQLCEPGQVRQTNEDRVFAASAGDTGLFLVCDGMGGHEQGEYASSLIAAGYAAWWERLCREKARSFSEQMGELKDILLQTHNGLLLENRRQGRICGATLSLLFISGGGYGILHVGDSRIYEYSQKRVRQLTCDQTWAQEQRMAGRKERELRQSPNYGKLMQAVGCGERLQPFSACNSLRGQVFLLCSDGVYKVLGERRLYRFIRHPAEGLGGLREHIHRRGSPDNFSAILVDTRPGL